MSTWKSEKSVVAKRNARVAIIAAQFNEEYVDILLQNTQEGLLQSGVKEENIKIFRVPGSFEIPFACRKVEMLKEYDAIIALGIVLRGETLHFEMVAKETAQAIMSLNLSLSIPVIFGVLACENNVQVENRLSLGKDFAESTIKMMKY